MNVRKQDGGDDTELQCLPSELLHGTSRTDTNRCVYYRIRDL